MPVFAIHWTTVHGHWTLVVDEKGNLSRPVSALCAASSTWKWEFDTPACRDNKCIELKLYEAVLSGGSPRDKGLEGVCDKA